MINKSSLFKKQIVLYFTIPYKELKETHDIINKISVNTVFTGATDFNDFVKLLKSEVGEKKFNENIPVYVAIGNNKAGGAFAAAFYSKAADPEFWCQLKEYQEFVKAFKKLDEKSVKKNDFYFGFEIEGCVSSEAFDDLRAVLNSVYGKRHASIGNDGSVRSRKVLEGKAVNTLEIRTPALHRDEALKKLEDLLVELTSMSCAGFFETNETCGFHVNVSEKNIFNHFNRIYREQMSFNFMKEFNVSKWKTAFKRSRNRYCAWKRAPKNVKEVTDYAVHYSAINSENLYHDNAKIRRLEIRVAGGKNYHSNKVIGNFINEISEVLEKSAEAV